MMSKINLLNTYNVWSLHCSSLRHAKIWACQHVIRRLRILSEHIALELRSNSPHCSAAGFTACADHWVTAHMQDGLRESELRPDMMLVWPSWAEFELFL